MGNHNENNGFSYTYSAKEQAELKRIREKYENKGEDKLEKLRRLDRGVVKKASAVSMVFGIIGVLILGSGMSLAMTDIGMRMGMSQLASMITGISTGVVGGILTGLAYPIYGRVLKNEKKKIAPEILRLTDELMNK